MTEFYEKPQFTLDPDQSQVRFMEAQTSDHSVTLILDWATKQAALLDPTGDLAPAMKKLAENGFRLTSILMSRSEDLISPTLRDLSLRFPAIPIFVRMDQEPALFTSALNIHWKTDGDRLQVGNLVLECMMPEFLVSAFRIINDPIREQNYPQ